MQEIEGNLSATGLRIAIIVSRFNATVTEGLLRGARRELERLGHSPDDLTVVRVPGSYEIPQAAQLLAGRGDFDALVCLGALIRGETDHYEHLAREVSHGISRVALDHQLPVGFGLLTTETVEQALNRSGLKSGNKGVEAVHAAVELARLKHRLRD